jgi:O-antigen/teichoic acid export membrane protein
MQDDRAATAAAFAKSVRVIFAAAMPFYLGLAAAAGPLVLTVLGPKWAEAAPIVRLLALAMPAMTLNVLFSPVTDALGRPELGVRNGAVGAVLLGAAFLIGVRWGATGLALAWIAAYPLYTVASCRRSLPVIGLSARALAAAILPPALAAMAMAAVVTGLDALLPPLALVVRLAALVGVGALVYAGWLGVFARARLGELGALVRRRPATV